MRLILFSVAGLVAGTLLLGACGDDAADDSATPAGSGGPALSGAVVPNTFMTFSGERYRLVEVLQANLVDSGEFEPVGTAATLDVDAKDPTVYEREDDDEHLYTFAEGSGSGESAVPATWLRWRLES